MASSFPKKNKIPSSTPVKSSNNKGSMNVASSMVNQLEEYEKSMARQTGTEKHIPQLPTLGLGLGVAAVEVGGQREKDINVLKPMGKGPSMSSKGEKGKGIETTTKKKNKRTGRMQQLLDRLDDVHLQAKVQESKDTAWILNQIVPQEVWQGTKAFHLPLHFFDNKDWESKVSLYDWLVKGRFTKAVAMFVLSGDKAKAVWTNCIVTGYEEEEEQYVVDWTATAAAEVGGGGGGEKKGAHTSRPSPFVRRMFVCFETEDPFNVALRIIDAHERRMQAESLIRYNFYIHAMPLEDAPQLRPDAINSILSCALSGSKKLTTNEETSRLLEEVNLDYMRIMNEMVLKANIENIMDDFPEVRMPLLLDVFTPAPEYGIVYRPGKNFVQSTAKQTTLDSYLMSKEAIYCLLAVRKASDLISSRDLFCLKQCATITNATTNASAIRVTPSKQERERPISLTIDDFSNYQMQTNQGTMKYLKEAWVNYIAKTIRHYLLPTIDNLDGAAPYAIQYRLNESNRKTYEEAPLYRLLHRVNYMMEDSLRFLVLDSLGKYVQFIKNGAKFIVDIKKTNIVDIDVDMSLLYSAQELQDMSSQQMKDIKDRIKSQPKPPLFQVDLRPMSEQTEQNGVEFNEIEKQKKAIAFWKEKEKENRLGNNSEDDVGTGLANQKVLKPALRHYFFAYSTEPKEFVDAVVQQIKKNLDRLKSLDLVERLLLDRLFWPKQDTIKSVAYEEEWVEEICTYLEDLMERSVKPLETYCALYDTHLEFLNLNVEDYLKSLGKHSMTPPLVSEERKASNTSLTKKGATDDDANDVDGVADKVEKVDKVEAFIKKEEAEEGEDQQEQAIQPPLELAQLRKLVEKHESELAFIDQTVPMEAIDLGMFRVSCQSIRFTLISKHREIIDALLHAHMMYCNQVALNLCYKFESVNRKLVLVPKDVEELVQLQEYITGVDALIQPLQEGIADLLNHNSVFDSFHFNVSEEHSKQKWTTVAWPSKIATHCSRVKWAMEERKIKYAKQMESEQERFGKSLLALHEEIDTFTKYDKLSHVEEIALHGSLIEKKIDQAMKDVQLYNSREVLFGKPISEYDILSTSKKIFEPYQLLWKNAHVWMTSQRQWSQGSFTDLNADEIEKSVEQLTNAIQKAFKFFKNNENDACVAIAEVIKEQIKIFKPYVPLIVALRNPGMKLRHWNDLSNELGFNLEPDESLTLNHIYNLKLLDYLEVIVKVADIAGKEHQIEVALDSMKNQWDSIDMQIVPYRETGTYVLKGVDEIQAVLDEHITMTQAMQFSSFKGPYEQEINDWNSTLQLISEVLEEWMTVQRNWLYLQPIFDSPDINKQLPTEGKRFASVDKNWRQTLSLAKSQPKCLDVCSSEKLLEKFKESNAFLDIVQKGLSDYLEVKRSSFARFYFLSNDELLSILSESKDVKLVQPHLKKCFEGIVQVHFEEDLTITAMISAEGERVRFSQAVNPNDKNVEFWMSEVERMMKISMSDIMYAAIQDYVVTDRVTWIQKWPGMCVLNGSQLHWTREMEQAMDRAGEEGVKEMYARQLSQLADMVMLVRGKLDKMTRMTMGALTVIDVHARDVTKKLVTMHVNSKADFLWSSQLKYYWREGSKGSLRNELDANQKDSVPFNHSNSQTSNSIGQISNREESIVGSDEDESANTKMIASMVTSHRPYGFEYLGNSMRLVITPLTDKCYLTLMGALQMTLGGAPAGPAGTGKTETTKDLAKALAKQCVVFNCSDGLDYIAMGKFFKGLASCGAWACFDEFNRIDIEVLSVVGQQIMTIQLGIRRGERRILFEDSDIHLDAQFGVFITMNPGYAGRTELPDSLAALFRPVAMMVPDYALIGEIMFFAYGFADARILGSKMVNTFKLCSEQLSSQCHYDYGMRAVKTVITAAGNLKRADPNLDEEVLLLRALQDVNLPKFLAHDIPLFHGIISDIFPGKKRSGMNLGALVKYIKIATEEQRLQPVPFFLTKCVQLYETLVVRHGLMLVGPTGGGKSCNLDVLARALTALKKNGEVGFAYEKVVRYELNPKAITMGQLYGQFDANTHEWQDGILSTLYRSAAACIKPDRKWVIFDGPVDALWIENMNTVLDDNKKLCLNSGEMLQMSEQMTMMFEVEDLSVASPATVSRTGMVYMEPTALGFDPLLQSWLENLPTSLLHLQATFLKLFDLFIKPSMAYLRNGSLRQIIPLTDNNIVASILRILDCYLAPHVPLTENDRMDAAGEKPRNISLDAHLESIFFYALVWSVGVSITDGGRFRFDAFFRAETANHAKNTASAIPKEGLVYDYCYVLEKSAWVKWMDTLPLYVVPEKADFAEIVVPTMDSVRNTFLLHLLVQHGKHALIVGATGTGKTVNISRFLQQDMATTDFMPVSLTFSAQTSANQTQDLLDSKMEKRRKGVFGPPSGKKMIVYVDDLNMPKREKYFAQPPLELLRQWFAQQGWYDRSTLSFRSIVDVQFIASMGPPGGGRNPITPRLVRLFHVIGYAELSDASKSAIFSAILSNFLTPSPPDVRVMEGKIVAASIEMYNTICKELLPTPAKSHYTFNLRDLAKVFQGCLMCDPKRTIDAAAFVRLWIHENQRVFEDRMTCKEDHAWFLSLVRNMVTKHLKMSYSSIVLKEHLIYGDFMIPGAEPKVYEEVVDVPKIIPIMEEYLSDFNAESKSPMPLVLFMDAMKHVARISRILRQPLGNALLLGVGGSGRQSLTRLATFMAGFALFQIEIVKGYGLTEWRENVRTCLLQAGLKDTPVVFLFSDVQIVDETMLEDLNGILNAGDVPNLYGLEEMEQIMTVCRMECQRKQIAPTKSNMFAQYIQRVRRNIHVVVCMSPIGHAFRERLRMFPSLVNCCTIDWFSEWPAEALSSVATAILQQGDLQLPDLDALVPVFQSIHQTVQEQAKVYMDTLRRFYYVTPTSYLELLSTFKAVLVQKREQVHTMRSRLQNGVDKIGDTKALVSLMQHELVELQPVLAKTQVEVDDMMIQITKDSQEADATKAVVSKEEKAASDKARITKDIADSAQRDLDEALPALDAAVACLNQLKKADIDEVKALKTPPAGVKLTMEVVCILLGHKPVLKPDPLKPGKKIADYWETAKKDVLSNANKFMENLLTFDKDNIPDAIVATVEPYIADPNFTPAAIEKSSQACTAICMWARAMHTYHFVAKGVAPKKEALASAQKELDETLTQLRLAQGDLKAVTDRLAELEASFQASVSKKEELAKKVIQCQVQLGNAEKLIGGLGGEEARWKETVTQLSEDYVNLTGDVLIASGGISYLGAFTAEFREALTAKWRMDLTTLHIPHTINCDVTKTLSDPLSLRAWQLAGLPIDSISTQNGIILSKSRRWPLMIDPQGQASRFIKNLGKNKELCPNGMDVVKPTDKSFLRTLENGIRFGKWVVLEDAVEDLDAALEPVLLQQKFKQGGQEVIKLGDNTIPYNDAFRFYITTRLSNPHYPPEVCVKVTLLNFTITMKGLEEQLLGVVVQKEMPELAEKKSELMISNAASKKQLYDIESQILYLLSHSVGNILDDTDLIETLASAKKTSGEVSVKMKEAEETETEIDARSNEYRPVAYRAALLFFCMADLSRIDPMYQYSLPWFNGLFIRSIATAKPAYTLADRLLNLNESFTYHVYKNICRSLFEKHKLLFSFLMITKIMQGSNEIDAQEWRFLLSGQVSSTSSSRSSGSFDAIPNPAPAWIEAHAWQEICSLSLLPSFSTLAVEFKSHLALYKALFTSNEPQCKPLPDRLEKSLDLFQKLCVLRCLRPDKMMPAIQNLVTHKLGKAYIEPPPFDLQGSFEEATPLTPLIFILSTGSDPAKDLLNFATECSMNTKLKSIALGQGQGHLAARMIEAGIAKGEWVLLQNCHLALSWMPDLERICNELDPTKVHADFRLWLTSKPTQAFPASVLQNGVKMTKEAPQGIRANLKNTYLKLSNDKLNVTTKPREYQKLLFGLSFFHAVVCERKRFGALGWNIPYQFNDTDLDISIAQLELFLDTYEDIPYEVLRVMTSLVNYGGRITDDKDMRTCDIILLTFFRPEMLKDGYQFSKSGIYYSVAVDPQAPYNSYVDYIHGLPINPEPEIFGMHENANITCAQSETYDVFDLVLSLQPRVSAGVGGKSREDIIHETALSIEEKIPPLFDLQAIKMMYPVSYAESMHSVLLQELERFNHLLKAMKESLGQLQKGLKGLVVLSAELEAMGHSLYDQKVPALWETHAYPSLKPLAAWVKDFLERLEFMTKWIQNGKPTIFWISAFFFPQAFMTGTLQNHARKFANPIDSLSFAFLMIDGTVQEAPTTGCYIHGIFLEGARWNATLQSLDDPIPRELFARMPIIHLLPQQHRETPTHGIYRCPVYKILTRTGTLSTTGHSTNFVMWIEIPSLRNDLLRSSLVSETNAQVLFCDQEDWIKAGVACFCSLRY